MANAPPGREMIVRDQAAANALKAKAVADDRMKHMMDVLRAELKV